jgi:hypothetical protein
MAERYNARQCTHHAIITKQGPGSIMVVSKDKTTFHTSHNGTTITFLLIGIIITTSISSAFALVLNQNHTVIAQQQLQQQQLLPKM